MEGQACAELGARTPISASTISTLQYRHCIIYVQIKCLAHVWKFSENWFFWSSGLNWPIGWFFNDFKYFNFRALKIIFQEFSDMSHIIWTIQLVHNVSAYKPWALSKQIPSNVSNTDVVSTIFKIKGEKKKIGTPLATWGLFSYGQRWRIFDLDPFLWDGGVLLLNFVTQCVVRTKVFWANFWWGHPKHQWFFISLWQVFVKKYKTLNFATCLSSIYAYWPEQ